MQGGKRYFKATKRNSTKSENVKRARGINGYELGVKIKSIRSQIHILNRDTYSGYIHA